MNEPKNGQPTKNGGALSQALLTLAGSSNSIVQLGTLAAVILGAIGSFWQGEKISSQAVADRDRAIRQIAELHSTLTDWQARQKKTVENIMEILDKQSALLRSQSQVLDNQQRILTELHRAQQNWKNPEQ